LKPHSIHIFSPHENPTDIFAVRTYVIGVIVDPFIHLIKINKNALININFTLDQLRVRGYIVVFNATFNTISAISWQSVLLVEETGIPGETHRPAASHR